MKLRTLYRLAQQFDAQSGELYRVSNWTGHSGMIAARDKTIEAIVQHPRNKLSRIDIMCNVIAGLSKSPTTHQRK